MSELETSHEQDTPFYVSCEYHTAGENGEAFVTKFGGDLFGDPHIERTCVGPGGQVEKATVRAYHSSEPAILIGLIRHLAADMDQQQRQDLRAQILRERDEVQTASYPLTHQQSDDDYSQELRVKLDEDLVDNEVLAETLLYGQGEYYLTLVKYPNGVEFMERFPIYAEDSELEIPPIVGEGVDDVFFVPDSEIATFAAYLSKSDRGRVSPDSLRRLLDGLLPAGPEE